MSATQDAEVSPVSAAATTEPILLIDLASIVYPLWHMSGREPDPDWTSTRSVARVHELASGRAHVAVCGDLGRSHRKDLDPTYKANRPEKDAPFVHQMRLTKDALIADGFPLWEVPGFEADDVIATATMQAIEAGRSVLIASSDKDLLQLVDDAADIRVRSLTNGAVYDAKAVEDKFGVPPSKMAHFLALVGDSADNIKGVPGIGPKKAAALLKDPDRALNGLTPGEREAMAKCYALIVLRTDAPIPFTDIFNERVSTRTEAAMTETVDVPVEAPEQSENGTPVVQPEVLPPTQLATIESTGDWTRQLEPITIDGARTIAKWIHEGRLFAQYGSPQAVFSVILAGRELGLGTMASLRAFHVIEGKPAMAADFIRSLVLTSNKAEYFVCRERTADRATWVTKRKGDPEPVTLTYTMGEAQAANLVQPRSGWAKHPADMLAKTASSKLARLVYPDVTFGLYGAEELGGAE